MGTIIKKETPIGLEGLEGFVAGVVDDLQEIVDKLKKKLITAPPKLIPPFEMLLRNDLKGFVQNHPQAVYAALCNVVWQCTPTEQEYSCSWRYAGGLVAEIVGAGEDYMDYYCSGYHKGNVPEGKVTAEVAKALADYGWRPIYV